MRMLRQIWFRLRALVDRSAVNAEIDDELRFHVDREARENVRRGMTGVEARQAALVAFGGVQRYKEECADTRRTRWIEDVMHDLRYGLRMLRRDLGYTGAAVAALAVGIGANTALFTLFTAVVLKPLPIRDPASVVSLYSVAPRVPYGEFSFAEYVQYRDHNSVFASVAAQQAAHLKLTDLSSSASGSAANGAIAAPDSSSAESVMGLFVSANYLATMGVRPALGRSFLPEEDLLTGPPYPALVSANYWQRRYGGDPGVVGKNVLLSGIRATVVGITPRDFMGTRPEVPDVWVAMSALGDPRRRALDRASLCCALTARLKPGVTVRRAQAEMSVLFATVRRDFPQTDQRTDMRVAPAVAWGPAHAGLEAIYAGLQAAMSLVLLIACANVAGLLLGRAASRQREIAVRLAMGASRSRIVRQLVTESVILALVAGGAALPVTWAALAALAKLVSPVLAVDGGSVVFDVAPDMHVFAYIALVSIVAGVSFALAPALQATRPDLVTALKHERAGLGIKRSARLRGWLVAVQIAVCLALLIGAGALATSSARLLSVEPGFETRHTLRMSIVDPQELGYSASRARDLRARLHERMRALPGIVVVSLASRVPLGENIRTTVVLPDLAADPATLAQAPRYPYSLVSQDYFRTLDIPLASGRDFTKAEIETNAPVAVISAALARRLWPDGNAVGRRIAIGTPGEVHYGDRPPESASTEVIGVARDVRSLTLLAVDAGYLYLPKPLDEWDGNVLVRVAGDPAGVAAALAREARAVEPRLSLSIQTMDRVAAGDFAFVATGLGGMIFSVIGLLGFVLASVGVYSMVAYTVRQQTREIGIRMALGARTADVLRVLLAATTRSIGTGVVVGALLGLLVSRGLAALLQGQQLLEPSVLVVVSLVTAAFAMLAAYVSARRATKLDPAVTLRFD